MDHLKIKLDRPVDRERPCCRNICIVGTAYELTCADCGQHRGRLSPRTAQWIEHVATRFGAPTTPIIVRKIHTFEEEAPDTDTKFSCREEEAGVSAVVGRSRNASIATASLHTTWRS